MDNVTDVYNYIAEWSPNITLHCDLGAGKHTPVSGLLIYNLYCHLTKTGKTIS